VCVFIILLLVLEFAARLVFSVPHGYFLLTPNTKLGFRFPSGLLADVPGGAPKHSVNAQGVIGDSLSGQDTYRILAIGGSTTACSALDGPRTWPARVQAILAERRSPGRIWVGQVGKAGLNTRHHLITLSRFLPQHPKLDGLILLVGVNDFLLCLGQGEQFAPMSLEQIDSNPELLARTFEITPPETGLMPWYKRLGLWGLAVRTRTMLSLLVGTRATKELTQAPLRRRNARVLRQDLPDLEPALHEYEQNLKALISRAQAMHLRH